MIKLWKGIEKEGIGKKSEVMTLFVCSDIQLSDDFIINVLELNKDIKSVYFGAGRQVFRGMIGFSNFNVYCKNNNIHVVIEITPSKFDSSAEFISFFDAEWVTFIVAFYDFKPIHGKLLFKTDDWNTTKIYACKKNVDITCVEDNRYPCDVLLYEED